VGLINIIRSWFCPHKSKKEIYDDMIGPNAQGFTSHTRIVEYICKACNKTVKKEKYVKTKWGFELVREEFL
jgi:hypothetical protein